MLGRRDPQRVLEDSFYARMGAVQDTYTLIRKGIRRVLKVAGYHLPAKKRGLSADLAAYLDRDR
jgi:hypothetical protein